MNLDDAKSLVGQSRERTRYRMALMGVIPILTRRSPLDRLSDDKEVPATKVAKHLEEVLAYENSIFRPYVDYVRSDLEAMRDYVASQIEVEKVAAIAKRLVTQAIGAGMKYGAIQRMVLREMDSRDHNWPDEGGW